jgi:hypothetical protein
MSTIFQGVNPSNFRLTRGSVFVMPLDPVTLEPVANFSSLGSVTCELDQKVEYVELRDNQDDRRPVVDKPAVQVDLSLKIGAGQFTPALISLAHMSTPNVFQTQTAQAAETTTFNGVTAGDVVCLKTSDTNDFAYDVVITGIVDNAVAPNTLVNGTHYRYDSLSGVIQFLGLVDPTKNNLTVSWNAPVLAAADGKQSFGLFQNLEQKAAILIRQNNRIGANLFYTFPKCQLLAPPSMKLIDDSNNVSIAEIEATVMCDSRQAPGMEYGWGNILLPKHV